jgi:hypothetical protein
MAADQPAADTPPPTRLSRRGLLAGAAAVSLGGCGNNQVFGEAAQTLRNLTLGPPETPIPRATVAKLPYATITAKVGDLPRGLMGLSKIAGQDLHWVASNRVSLVTRRGRLVKTVGLPQDLRDTRAVGEDPLAQAPHRLAQPARSVRLLDLARPEYYEMPIDSVLTPVGPQKITILEIEFDTVLLTEQNSARTLRWRFENQFWVDPEDGFVWKSVQHIGRELPVLQIEVAKPPAPLAAAG